MRSAGLWFVPVCLAVLLSGGSALAKGTRETPEGIELTGIKSFDKVFRKVDGIDQRLTNAERDLQSGQQQLNTSLELKRGAPFSDAIAELKERAEGKLELSVSTMSAPTLSTTDAVPSNVQRSVDALNALTLDVTSALDELSGIGPEIDALVRKTGDMPANLREEFKKDSGSLLSMLFELPKTSKTLSHDLAVTRELPGRAVAVTEEMTALLDIVHSEFRGGGGGQGSVDRERAPEAAPQPEPQPTKRREEGGAFSSKPSRARAQQPPR